MNKRTLLIELGCEELPASAQKSLSDAIRTNMTRELEKNKLNFGNIKVYATPRRLAVSISELSETQSGQIVEKQGPGINNAFDKSGSPTLACLGFAKSCGVTVDQLKTVETSKGKRLVYLSENPGAKTKDILPEIITQVFTKLPISKPMRWGENEYSFIRPVHWLVSIFGNDVIPMSLFGVNSGCETKGHRFHHPKNLKLNKAEDYNMILYSQGYVIADFESRKKLITKSMQSLLHSDETLVENENLLDEVTALVEWPVALRGSFSSDFLEVPKEALITAMETHQKCFSILDKNGDLKPCFILISNIESKDPATVIKGNEKVICARLSDAKFFYDQDKKTTLESRVAKLDTLIFQNELGSVGDKTKRIYKLAEDIAKDIDADINTTKTAAKLCKADLVSEMVCEFTNLQGTMGYYYALHDDYSQNVATAILEHYLPRFSGDKLPETLPGCCLAIADRIDTIVGIIGINKVPTGDKDPFALRRAALGIIRILIEKDLPINLLELIRLSSKFYINKLPNPDTVEIVFNYIMARLKAWYQDQGISAEVFEAVLACNPITLQDFDKRVKAVIEFQKMPEATSLSAANKRVSNILKKQATDIKLKSADSKLFECEAEHALAKQLADRDKIVSDLYKNANYEKALAELSILKAPIDQFFDDVMIMVDDEKVKQNRLLLLANIRELFTKVADISLLPQ